MKLDIVTRQTWNTMVTALTASLSAWQAARKNELDASRTQAVSLAQSAQATAQQGVNAAQSLYQQATAALGIPAARTSYTTALPPLGAENELGAWRDSNGNTVIGQVVGGEWVALANQGSASTKAVQQAAASALAAPLLQRFRAGEGLRLGVLTSSTFSGYMTVDGSLDPNVYQLSERGAGMRFWRALANRYGNNNVVLINRGIAGARSRDLWLGNQQNVSTDNLSGVGLMSAEGMVRAHQLDAILIQINHNDAGTSVTPEQYYQHLYWAYMGARRCGAMVFMVPPLAYGGYWNPNGQERQYHRAALRAAADAGAIILPVHEALANPQRTSGDFSRGWYQPDGTHITDAGAARYADEMLSYLVDDVSAARANQGDGTWLKPSLRPGLDRATAGVLVASGPDMTERRVVNEIGLVAGHADLGQWSVEKQPFYLPPRYLPRRAVWAAGLGVIEAQGYGAAPGAAPVANVMPDLTRFTWAPLPLGGVPGATAPTSEGAAYVFAGSQAQRIALSNNPGLNRLFGRDHISVTVAVKIPAGSGNSPGGAIIGRSDGSANGWLMYITGGKLTFHLAGTSGADGGVVLADDTLHVITITAQMGGGYAQVYVDGVLTTSIAIGSNRSEFEMLLGARWSDGSQTAILRQLTGRVYLAAIGAAYLSPDEVAQYHADLTTYLKGKGA